MRKKTSLVVTAFLFVQFGFAQKKSETQLDLTNTKIEHCILENGKTITSKANSSKVYLPVESLKEAKGLKINFSNFTKTGEASDIVGSINITYSDDDGNEKKSTWAFYKEGKKTVYFNAFEINRNRDTVNIDPRSIKEIHLGFGKNKKVDVIINVIN